MVVSLVGCPLGWGNMSYPFLSAFWQYSYKCTLSSFVAPETRAQFLSIRIDPQVGWRMDDKKNMQSSIEKETEAVE